MSTPKKYFIVSDLHLEFRQGKEEEFWERFPEHGEVKTCICAGDLTVIRNPRAFSHFSELCSRFDKVIYVPGNHEYYGSNPIETDNALNEIVSRLSPVLTLLRAGDVLIHDGQRFIGDTMWFPDRPEVHVYKGMITDSFKIAGMFPWAFERSTAFMSHLRDNITEDDVVITHHIPNDVDTEPKWKSALTQPYFINDTCHRYFIDPETLRPKAWIYGHTHGKHDYTIGRTRFICNPLGYPFERNNFPQDAEPVIFEI